MLSGVWPCRILTLVDSLHHCRRLGVVFYKVTVECLRCERQHPPFKFVSIYHPSILSVALKTPLTLQTRQKEEPGFSNHTIVSYTCLRLRVPAGRAKLCALECLRSWQRWRRRLREQCSGSRQRGVSALRVIRCWRRYDPDQDLRRAIRCLTYSRRMTMTIPRIMIACSFLTDLWGKVIRETSDPKRYAQGFAWVTAGGDVLNLERAKLNIPILEGGLVSIILSTVPSSWSEGMSKIPPHHSYI